MKNPKIILLPDGLKYLANVPEEPNCECDEVDGAGDFESQHDKCERRFKIYTQALEQAIKEGVKFKDVEVYKNPTGFTDITFKGSYGRTLSVRTFEQGKLYDIPIGYQSKVIQQRKHDDADEWIDCDDVSVNRHGSYQYRKIAVLEPLTKQEPEKSLPKPEFLRPPEFSDETNSNVIKPSSNATPVIEQKEEASEFLKSKVAESGKYKILGQLPFALYPTVAEVMEEYAESKQLTPNDGWISVKERLPKNNEKVLCFSIYGRQMQNSYSMHTDQDADWFKRMFTHWRELLPKPPSNE